MVIPSIYDFSWENWVQPGSNFAAPVTGPTQYLLESASFESAKELFRYQPNQDDLATGGVHMLALEKNEENDYATIKFLQGNWDLRLRRLAEEIIFIPAMEADGKKFLDAIGKDGHTKLEDIEQNNLFGTDVGTRPWKVVRWTVEKGYDVDTSEAVSIDTMTWFRYERPAGSDVFVPVEKVITMYYWVGYVET